MEVFPKVYSSNPIAAAKLDAFRRFGSTTERHPDELLIVRVYHQKRRPITSSLASFRGVSETAGWSSPDDRPFLASGG